jgi:hypothetical protein
MVGETKEEVDAHAAFKLLEAELTASPTPQSAGKTTGDFAAIEERLSRL